MPVTANGRKKPEGGFSGKEGNTNENIFKKKNLKTSGVVHESSYDRSDCEPKVEGGVTPGLFWLQTMFILFSFHLDSGLPVRESCHQNGEV